MVHLGLLLGGPRPQDPTGRVKVEPKTFFANERTFIQWLQPAVFLVSVVVGLQSLGVSFKTHLAKAGGIALCILALAFMLYSLFIYLRRIRRISERAPEGYDEQMGPILIVALLTLVIAISTASLLVDQAGLSWDASGAPGAPTAESCGEDLSFMKGL